jgi:lipoate-protein ligase A
VFFFTNDHLETEAAIFRGIEIDGGPETIRFWESQEPAVIVGSLASVPEQVHEDACRADNIPILRRISGGGAVVVGPGCLNYSLVLSLDARPELRSVESSYRLILGRFVEELRQPGLAIRGLGDLSIGDRKIAGSAQRRGRRALLHHGSFLYDFDPGLMERYLKQPRRQPAYRSGRSHADFVANAPIPPDSIKEAMTRAWRLIECRF